MRGRTRLSADVRPEILHRLNPVRFDRYVKTSLVRLGLEALIAKESARRLANLGGTEKQLRAIRRRRPRKSA